MKIALLHYTAPPVVGGVESVLAHHAQLFTESGHEVTIFCGRGEPFNPAVPVCVHPLFDSRNSDVLAVKDELDAGICTESFSRLRDQIREILLDSMGNYDHLIVHNVASMNKNLPLTSALHAVYQSLGFPHLILWHHDFAWTTPRYQQELHDGYPWNLLRESWPDVTNVVISRARCQELSDLIGLPEDQIQIIPNGVDLYSFYRLEQRTIELIERTKLLESDPLLLTPVRLTPRKNIEMALRIVSELRNEYPQIKLLITGPEGPHNPANRAYRDKLYDLRDHLDLHNSVLFIAEITPEFLPDEVISDFFRLADALLFPSVEEGFGIPLLEAGFSNIPVYCADIPVLRELGGEYLCYFDPQGDPVSIARQISENLKSDFTSRWSRYVKHNYTWQSIFKLCIAPLLKEGEEDEKSI